MHRIFFMTLSCFVFCSCGPNSLEIVEDILEGELETVKKVEEDLSGVPHKRPSVNVIDKNT